MSMQVSSADTGAVPVASTMSKLKVQCKGSGLSVHTSVNATRALCPICHRMRDLTGAGKIKRHDRLTSKANLRKS